MSGWTVPGSLGDWPGDWTVPGYTEERRLGRGVSGRVVAAVNEETGQRVAIKYLSRALVRDPVFLWSFRSEAGLLATLDIPQVVQVFDYVEEPGQGAAIVMELVHGVSLHEMISRSGPVEPEAALVVLKDSLLGLAAAHGLNIVHRDYKPENVLIDAAGNSRLADFGVAVRAGKQMPVAGTPLYMAPEEWNGAPSSPATDIYAATAVLYECLTGTPPFAGRPAQLRQQHETAAVPLDGIGVPALRSLLARGLAKEPADRPATAIAFVADLESAAASGYGPDWEERGRSQLAARAAALLAPLGGAVARSAGLSWLARRRSLTVAAITLAAVVTLGAAAMAALTVSKGNDPAQTTSSSSSATTNMPTFEAQAAVTPPVTASQCASAARFTYSGTVTSTGAGNLSYQWVYSSGQKGPVQTVSFTGAGHRQVTGETVTTTSAGSGWGEIKMISPAGTSNKASYKLVCSGNIGGISPVASVQPASASVTCGTPVPNFTATGSITSLKAETVTYYWALSDGRTTAPATMTFSGPGTLLAEPLTLTPLGDPTSGQAVLVVSSPVTVVSSPAP
ncbi:MAG TPA: serine/threonine-protein kinase, partial [Trebonia sp.]|nr:serine/threonine-protein kinase [Trebonia sp.]